MSATTFIIQAATISKDTLYLYPGEKTSISLTGTNQQVRWLKGKFPGTVKSISTTKATIIANKSCGNWWIAGQEKDTGKKYHCHIFVVKAPVINKTTATIDLFTKTRVSVSDGKNRKFLFSSSNNNIVSVSSDGIASPVDYGTAVITAKNGTTTLKCTITVKPKKLKGDKKTWANQITAQQWDRALDGVSKRAIKEKWHYDNSKTKIPSKDRVSSCDRLIARALYDLGFTDQRIGGETCGSLNTYLKNHGFHYVDGFKYFPSMSIVLVKHKGQDFWGHAYVASSVNYEKIEGTKSGEKGFYYPTYRYDFGTTARIQSKQPIKVTMWVYRTDTMRVFSFKAIDNVVG